MNESRESPATGTGIDHKPDKEAEENAKHESEATERCHGINGLDQRWQVDGWRRSKTRGICGTRRQRSSGPIPEVAHKSRGEETLAELGGSRLQVYRMRSIFHYS